MHIGRVVTVEGEAAFDQVVMVYDPGVPFMGSMVRSTFFQGIVGGKRPADALSRVTAPILRRFPPRFRPSEIEACGAGAN